MPLELHLMEEPDFPDFVRIQLAAFSTGIISALMPQPLSPERRQKTIDKHVTSFREEKDVTYLKVIDTDLGGKLIAAAKWRINEKERTEEEIQPMLPVPGKDEEDNLVAQDFMRYLHRMRSTYMGTKPFSFLHILITDPEHQKRGAGRMLLRWGAQKADKAQLPSFLEASDAGRPLYESEGFKPVHEEIFDGSKYGLEGTERNTAMIRDPAR
ncbi:hypothetical protein BS50DRAFT_497461 [Corynespora cassiicola Philippines]|uniref:N-acetyltransferase domain-containing protein n=1 Tax=Corynespora cassiicola Philippines TaxID=1448308 RepID=A0A2T2NJF6_CORCC|nr:hypothetical protein BS50DRAFT_497461 [Corynespora cassiicola Philippines]